MIRLQALHKYFNRGKQNEIHVLNDVTLELPERGMVAIFGKSGCGKTTLLNVIGGLDRYASGSLTVEGREIREAPDLIRNRYMGYIFQSYHLQGGVTCYENVAAALRLSGMDDGETLSSRVTAALQCVGMEKYASRTPETLSGGQQQRVAIARAIVKNPRIILADEPTGNLDEANTVMIMELLREIADTHLVLLVTHEQRLVDRYCDKVIEMADGKIGSIRDNAPVGGTVTRDKNAIYLGELAHTTLADENARIGYFGEPPASPIDLSIVSSDGKLYLKINTPGVQVIDDGSEIKLLRGVFEEKAASERSDTHIDMSALPPFEGTRYGRLFTLRSSLREGAASLLRRGKRGKRALRACMCLFAAALVMMTAVFGTAFSSIDTVSRSYNHSTFYVWDPDGSVSDVLCDALSDERAAIDHVRIYGSIPPEYEYQQARLTVVTDFFETFSEAASNELSAIATPLSEELLRDLPPVIGKTEGLAENELVITTAVADALLDGSTLRFLDEYRDLLGLATLGEPISGLAVVGIVRSEEHAVYLSKRTAAQLAIESVDTYILCGSDFGIPVETGTVTLAIRDSETDDRYPTVGETVKIHGISLTVGSILRYAASYDEWLRASGSYVDELAFITEKIKVDYPDYVFESDESGILYGEYLDRFYFDCLDAYYASLDGFIREQRLFEYNLPAWLYLEKGVKEAAIDLMMYHDGDTYLRAQAYKKEHGAYPTLSDVRSQGVLDGYAKPSDVLYSALTLYEDEYYATTNELVWGHEYLLSDEDLIRVAGRLGDTASTAYPSYGGTDERGRYLLVHSSSPATTKAFLESTLGDLTPPREHLPAILTPSDIRDSLFSDRASSIIGNLIALAVVLFVMSLCMYFIMRSSLLSRVKEVGVWRAIGVSRRNLVFRFLIEAAMLTTLTVLVGYLPISILLLVGTGGASLLSSVLYYPLPLALVLLGILYGVCLLTGILPIVRLISKTPSEILAKHDI